MLFFFSSRRRHTRCGRDWSSDVCSSDLGQRLLVFEQLIVSAGKHDLTTLVAGLRAEIDDVIAFLDDLRVMLDDDDGVLVRPQTLENLDQSTAVAWMKTDGRLVEHVESIDE